MGSFPIKKNPILLSSGVFIAFVYSSVCRCVKTSNNFSYLFDIYPLDFTCR